VALLHKHFSFWLSTFCNSVSIITNCKYVSMSKSNLMMSAIHVPFSSWVITSNSSLVLTVFRQFFTWITLNNTDLHFLLILVTKANAVEGTTTSAAWLYHQCSQSIHVTDGMTATSLSASLWHKKRATTDHVGQITLNWKLWCINLCQVTLKQKLLHTFKKWYKFSTC
jgi:hypothetical protein